MTPSAIALIFFVLAMVSDVVSTVVAFDKNPFAYEKGVVASLFGRQPEWWELACLKVAGAGLPLSIGSAIWGFETSWVFSVPLTAMHLYFVYRNSEVAERKR